MRGEVQTNPWIPDYWTIGPAVRAALAALIALILGENALAIWQLARRDV